jgi:hypothetical protein
MEVDVFSDSSVITCVRLAAVTFLLSSCQATTAGSTETGGKYLIGILLRWIYRHADSMVIT